MELRRMAYDLAEENNLPHKFNNTKKLAGKKWYYNFMKRHPRLSLRAPEPTSLARAHGFNRVIVSLFFGLLEKTVDDHAFNPKTSTTWMNPGYHQSRNLVGYFPQRGKTGRRDDQWRKRPDN